MNLRQAESGVKPLSNRKAIEAKDLKAVSAVTVCVGRVGRQTVVQPKSEWRQRLEGSLGRVSLSRDLDEFEPDQS